MSAPFQVKAYGCPQAEVDHTVVPVIITRRALGPNDTHIKIKHTSICHTDHLVISQQFFPATGLQVPGHEMVGEIVAVGSNVKNHKVGDIVGVGCMFLGWISFSFHNRYFHSQCILRLLLYSTPNWSSSLTKDQK